MSTYRPSQSLLAGEREKGSDGTSEKRFSYISVGKVFYDTSPRNHTLTLHSLARPHPLLLAPPFPKSLPTVLTCGEDLKSKENTKA